MTVIETSQLAEVINSFNHSAELALGSESADDYARLEQELNDVEGYVREVQQAMWGDEAKTTLKRLEKGEPLTPTDKDVIRAFLVSDAERYLANENNYGDWVRELRRLMADLSKRCNIVDRDTIADLRGVLKDVVRLIPGIRNYLEERKRVERFDLAVDELDTPSRNMLVRIIREQLYSPNR